MSFLSSIDLSSFADAPATSFRPRVSRKEHPIVQTDWDWMLREAVLGGSDVAHVLSTWSARRSALLKERWTTIHAGMVGFVHKRLYTVTLAEIDVALRETERPFGGTDGKDRDHGYLRDATTPSPINLVLHALLERIDRVPTWQDFESHIRRHPAVLLSHIADYTRLPLERFEGDWLAFDVGRALRFRLATAYNSFMRELHFRAALAERHGVFLSHHFMLDAEFKIDFTYRDIAIELYLANDFFKKADCDAPQNSQGRKLRCFDVNPGRDVEVVSFSLRQSSSQYDRPWLVADEDIDRTAANLLSGKVTHPRKPVF